jgi:hypothetical protein
MPGVSHGGYDAVVAVSQFLQRSAPARAVWWPLSAVPDAHMLSSRLGAVPAFGGAGADQVTLHIGETAFHFDHMAARVEKRC